MRLTPRQIELMKLIQMPVSELAQYIKEEVERNPVLDEVDDTTAALPSENDDSNDEWDDEDYRYLEYQERDPNAKRQEPSYSAEPSSMDRLIEQLELKPLSEQQRTIAKELVGNIDSSGYLSRDLMLIVNDLAFRKGIETTAAEVEAVLRIIQQCEPPGIGARTLQECLSIQLHNSDNDPTEVADACVIVDRYFDLFSRRQFDRLIERLNWDRQRLQRAIEQIHRLNPKPGLESADGGNTAPTAIPDFFVSMTEGQLTLQHNDSSLPQLQLDPYYQEMTQQLEDNTHREKTEEETLRFLREKVNDAKDFIENLNQRHHTVGAITQYIVRQQKKFFLSGNPNDLIPMQQKDVATATGYDTSTVSRVVNSKYLQTDFGLIPLRDCFTRALSDEAGNDIAVEHIKATLRHIVETEDKRHPLTDEALTEALQRESINVARRTVAKYREMMGIPVGRLRRMLKGIALLLLLSSQVQVSAQSYYDSLINAQLKATQNRSQTDRKIQEPATRRGSQLRTPPPNPMHTTETNIDTTNFKGIGALWYGNHFSPSRVRERILPLDSLPDEINLKLVSSDSDFCFPVKNIITSPYGWRWERAHRGVDIRLSVGTPVHCAFAGVVRVAAPMGAYGNLVVVRHYNGLETVYAHLSRIDVKPHQTLHAGDIVGLGGSTGRSTGPHLHFEVRFMYEAFDPEWILDFNSYALRTRKLHLDKSYFGIARPLRGEHLTYKADKSYVKEQVAKNSGNGIRYYTAKEEDDMALIALKCNTTVSKLRELNPEMKKLKPGMRLRVK